MTGEVTAEAACPRCADNHPLIRCPYVKALEFEDADLRLIRRVEFLTPADYGPAPKVAAPGDPEPAYAKLGQ